MGLGLLLVLPSLGAGFLVDDYLQLAHMEGWARNPLGPLDLFTFVPRAPADVARLVDAGLLPYFTAPDLRLAFWRPLSSALLQLDHALWGRQALPYHLHSLLWYAALLLAAMAVYRRTLPPDLTALALLLFCVDDSHVMAAGWVAARNASVATAPVLLGVVAHIRWREEGWRPGAVLAPLGCALGLLGGELALGTLGYLWAWELSARRPGRARALAPGLALAVIYLALHHHLGYGTRASGGYLDPFDAPVFFLGALPGRLLVLAGGLLAGTPIDLHAFDARAWPWLIGLGGAAVLGLGVWLPAALRRLPTAEARSIRTLGLGAAFALLVATPALPGERVLLPASVGGAVVLATLLRDGWRRFRARPRGNAAAAGAAMLVLGSVALSAVALPVKSALLGRMSASARRIAREAEVAAPRRARVLVLHMEDLNALYLPLMRVLESGLSPAEIRRWTTTDPSPPDAASPDLQGRAGWTVLSFAQTTHLLRRTGVDRFEVRTPGGTLLDGAWATTLRAPTRPMPAGTVVASAGFSFRVLDADGGRPTRVEVQAPAPLEDPALVLLEWRDGRFRRAQLPAMGQERLLERGPPVTATGP